MKRNGYTYLWSVQNQQKKAVSHVISFCAHALLSKEFLLPPPQAFFFFFLAQRAIDRLGVSKKARAGAGSEWGVRAQGGKRKRPGHRERSLRPSLYVIIFARATGDEIVFFHWSQSEGKTLIKIATYRWAISSQFLMIGTITDKWSSVAKNVSSPEINWMCAIELVLQI